MDRTTKTKRPRSRHAVETLNMMELLHAARAAGLAAARSHTGRGYGCGRAYVEISSTVGRATINAIAAACDTMGLIFHRKGHNGMRNSIYIGYDNADGRALANAKAFAASLTAAGISCWDEAQAD